jgi:hypothetical protein
MRRPTYSVFLICLILWYSLVCIGADKRKKATISCFKFNNKQAFRRTEGVILWDQQFQDRKAIGTAPLRARSFFLSQALRRVRKVIAVFIL